MFLAMTFTAVAVELCPPGRRRTERLPSVTVWAVHVVEEYPPAGVEPLDWLLLTTGRCPRPLRPRNAWSGTRVGSGLKSGIRCLRVAVALKPAN